MASRFFGKAVSGLAATIAVSTIFFALVGAASAQLPYGWDPTNSGGTTAGGSGTWSNSASNWWTGSPPDVTWTDGNDAYFGGTAGTVAISGIVSPNNLYFKTSGYTLSGTGGLTLTGGSVTIVPGGIATIASGLTLGSASTNLSVQSGTLQVSGPLSLGTSSALSIQSGAAYVLAQTVYASAHNVGFGGTINGNLVIATAIEADFNSAVSGAPGIFSGSGAIQYQTSQADLTNLSGYQTVIDVPVQLNSLNLPFTKYNVTSPVFSSSSNFGIAINATSGGTLTINAPITGNADALLTCNTYNGFGGKGALYLNAQCTYTGATMLEGNGFGGGAGNLVLGVSNALPVGTDVEWAALLGKNPTNEPVLDMNGYNQQVGLLTVGPKVTSANNIFIANNAANTSVTLTVSGATNPFNAFSARIVDHTLSSGSGSTVALMKGGPNTLGLSGQSTYSGGTTIAGGVIQLGNLATTSTSSGLGVGPVVVQSGATLAGAPATGASTGGGGATGFVNVQSGGQLIPGGSTGGAGLNMLGGLSLSASTIVSFVNGSTPTSQGGIFGGSGGTSSTLTLPNSADAVSINFSNQGVLSGVIPLFTFNGISGGDITSGTVTGGSGSVSEVSALDLARFTGGIPSNTTSAAFSLVLDNSPAVENYKAALGLSNTAGIAGQIDLFNPALGAPAVVNWATSSGAWTTSTAATTWSGGTPNPHAYKDGDRAIFPDVTSGTPSVLVTSSTISVQSGGVSPYDVVVTSNSTAYTFAGGPIMGFATFSTSGNSVTTLAATNSYNGGTYASAGTLVAAAGDLSLGNTASGLFLDNGATFVTTNSGITSSRPVSIATTGGSADTNATFNTNGLNSTIGGNVIVGNTSVSGTFTKSGSGTLTLGGATTLTDASGAGAVLNAQGGTLQINGGLTLGNYGSLNVAPSGTIALSNTGNSTIDQYNGGVINGNLVITQPLRLNFNAGTFSGTGQILVATPSGAIITNAGSLPNNGFAGTINPNIVLNSLGLPFSKTDVTQSTIATGGSSSFIATIGGTKGTSTPLVLTINGVISGNSDVNFSNSPGGGGSGNIQLNAENTYTGATLIDFTGNLTGGAQGGIVTLGINNALPTSTDVMFGAIGGAAVSWLDLEGFNQQIGSLSTVTAGNASSGYTITNQKPNSLGTLTISGTTTPYKPFAGTISDLGTGQVALVKSGANTLVLAGSGGNFYTGGTTVAGGGLFINNPNSNFTSTGYGFVNVSGGTFGGIGYVGDNSERGTPTLSVSSGAALYAGMPAVGGTTNSAGTLNVYANLNVAAGAALDFDFGAGSLSQLNVSAGSLNLPSSAASVAINLTNLNGLTGELTLIQSNMAIANTSSLYLGSAAPAGDSYVLSYDSADNAIDLTITSTAANLTWAGTADSSPHAWNVNSTANFIGARQTFNNGDFVTFDDSGVGGAVSISASGVAPGSLVFSNTAKSYSLSGGPIYGPTSLVLNGAGSVTLGGSNSYTGGTNISGGTLIAAAGDSSLGASSGTVAISGGATLAASNAGIVSGRDITIGAGGGTFNTNGLSSSTSGALTVNAPFTITGGGNFGFTTAADFSGMNSSLTITSGSATLAGNGTVNFRGGGTFNGNLVISGSSSRVNFDNYVFGGSGSIQVQNGGVVTASNTSTANGWPLLSNTSIGGLSLAAGTLGSSLTIDLNSTGAPFTSAATNLGSTPFVLQTNHNFITGIGATTFGQVLDVQASISGNADVVLGSNSNHGNGGAGTLLLSGSNTYTGATLIAGNGVLQLGANNTLPTTTDVIFGAVSNDTPTLDLHGYNQQINSLSEGGADAFSITNSGSSPSILTISGTTSPATAFSGAIRDGSSTIELMKEGSGTLELSGTNSYSGGTFVASGTLIVANAYGLNDGSSLTVGGGWPAPIVPEQVVGSSGVAAVPEPSTLALLAAGMAIVAFRVARRRKQ